MGRCTKRFRSRAERYQLISADRPGEVLRIVRLISLGIGERMVSNGTAVCVYGNGEDANWVIGFQLVDVGKKKKASPAGRNLVEMKPRDESARTISRTEHDAVVGLYGESKTAHMNEDMKNWRVKNGHEAEDLVERSVQKFRAYLGVR